MQSVIGIFLFLIFSSSYLPQKIISPDEQIIKDVFLSKNNYGLILYNDGQEKNINVLKLRYYKYTNYLNFNENDNKYLFIYNNENKEQLIENKVIENNKLNIEKLNFFFKKNSQNNKKITVFFSSYKYEQTKNEDVKLIIDFSFLSDFLSTYNSNYKVINQALKKGKFADESVVGFISLFSFCIFALVFHLKELKLDYQKLTKDFKKKALLVPQGVFGLFVGAQIALLISSLLSKMLNYQVETSQNQRLIELILTGDFKLLMVFDAIILAPFAEEIVFRKGLFSLIKSKSMALYVSSLAFALIHLLSEPNPVAMVVNLPIYMVAGLVLGGIYLLSGKNIFVSIYVHLIWNGLTFII